MALHFASGAVTARRLGAALLLAFPLAGCGGRDGPPIRNVVIVMIDALRADHLEPYGYERPTSPFLTRLTKRAVLFEAAQSAASQTVPSVLSLWTGVYPNRHGNQYFPATGSFREGRKRNRPQVSGELPLLAESFRGRGFATAAVVTNPWLEKRWGFSRGFGEYRHLDSIVRGKAVNAAAREILDGIDEERFLLYLHYMDVHNPYRPPAEYRESFVGDLPGGYVYFNGVRRKVSDEDVAYSRALYDAGIRAMDDVLADLVGELDARGLLDTTLLVIVADHGDEFFEHGGLGHGHSLHAEMVHVPLLLVHPSLDARRVRAPVSLVDVLPTLVELTGGAPPASIAGVSLVPLIEGRDAGAGERVVFHELGSAKSIRRGDHKLIRRLGKVPWPMPREQVYDLGSDPAERSALPAAPWADALRESLDAFVADSSAPGDVGGEHVIEAGSDRERQLRALGYLDD